MKSIKMLMAVCLAVGIAVFMSANSSVAADSGVGQDTVILSKGYGPGNGTGNGGSGPKDGTGNGAKRGTCTRLTSDTPDISNLIAGRGRGPGNGTGRGTGTGGGGLRNGTGPYCPRS